MKQSPAKQPILTAALSGLTLLLLAGPASADTFIQCPRLIDGVTKAVKSTHTIQIKDGLIVRVAVGNLKPDGADDKVITLTDATCMPGLIDTHVHITSELSKTTFVGQFRLDPADYALAAVPFAERTLKAGFTTVRDLGSSHNLSISLRDAINKGHIIGPRIYTAGKTLASTGGHADPTNGRNQALRGDPGPKEGVVNGADDAQKAVRQRYKDRADLIKITATGGVLSQAASGRNSQFTDEELAAIISTARDYGFKVAAHAHGAAGMKRAVIAGVDSIEHGTFMNEEIMRLMRKLGTSYVPTISAGKYVAEKAEEEGYFSAVIRPKAKAIGPAIQDTFARAYAAGVPIVFGTDSGVSPHGDNWKEFVYMVEAGMPEIEAILSANHSAARLLDIEDQLGTLTPGKIADIIAVAGNPVKDIGQMEHVLLVIKDGKVYRAASSVVDPG